MYKRLEMKLFKKYPFIAPRQQVDPLKQVLKTNGDFIWDLMTFGIQCDDGWYDILDNGLNKIKNHMKNKNDDFGFHAEQIKQKWGSLRFYYEGGDEYIEKVISEMEHKSEKTCEICGSFGILDTSRSYVLTLCSKHMKARKKLI